MILELTNGEINILLEEIKDALPKINKDGGQPLKFNLTVLFEKANEALKPFNKLKEEFMTEKCIPDENGNYSFKQLINETLPPNEDNLTPEFKEFSTLLNQKVEISFKTIPIVYFEKLNSDSIYPVLSKFVEL